MGWTARRVGRSGCAGTPRREISQPSGLERVDQGGSEWISRELVGVVSGVNEQRNLGLSC